MHVCVYLEYKCVHTYVFVISHIVHAHTVKGTDFELYTAPAYFSAFY